MGQWLKKVKDKEKIVLGNMYCLLFFCYYEFLIMILQIAVQMFYNLHNISVCVYINICAVKRFIAS